jgi:hypothetical protein
MCVALNTPLIRRVGFIGFGMLKGVTLLIRRGSSTIEQKPKEIENLLNSYKGHTKNRNKT